MKNLTKTLMAIIAAIMVVFALSATASAQSLTESTEPASVVYLIGHGVLDGTDFDPEEKISPEAFAQMAVRAIGEETREGKSNIETLREAGVCLDVEADFMNNGHITGDVALAILMPEFGLFPYPAAVYPDYIDDPDVTVRYENVRKAAELTGLGEIFEEKYSYGITWKQATDLLYRLMTGLYEPLTVPTTERPCEILEQWEATKENVKARNSIAYSWDRIPAPYLEKFLADGWDIIFETERVYNGALHEVPGGTFFETDKIISLNDCEESVLIHEFGHYMTLGCNDLEPAMKSLYEAESNAAHEILGDYAMTNPLEYTADAFEYYIVNLNNETSLNALREIAPRTVEFCEMLAKDEDGAIALADVMAVANGTF